MARSYHAGCNDSQAPARLIIAPDDSIYEMHDLTHARLEAYGGIAE